MKKSVYYIFIAGFAIIFTSCASAPLLQPVIPPVKEIHPQVHKLPLLRQDVFHTVAPGETLWRISKMYEVPVERILNANHLSRNQKLEMGQRLLVPWAASIQPVVSLYPSRKWKYIIIHHSATDEGSSLFFHKSHQYKGWDEIGYHFVIDNGTKGKKDGQIEVSPRWLKQKEGAHCKASDMNSKSIGICLVGNFSQERVSSRQMESLIFLVKTLRDYYNIPLRNIMGHGQVAGAHTECPGKYFPWDEFKRRCSASRCSLENK